MSVFRFWLPTPKTFIISLAILGVAVVSFFGIWYIQKAQALEAVAEDAYEQDITTDPAPIAEQALEEPEDLPAGEVSTAPSEAFLLPETFFQLVDNPIAYKQVIFWVFLGIIVFFLFAQERSAAGEKGDWRIVAGIIVFYFIVQLAPSSILFFNEVIAITGFPLEISLMSLMFAIVMVALFISIHGNPDLSPLYITLFLMGMVDHMVASDQGRMLLMVGIFVGFIEMMRPQGQTGDVMITLIIFSICILCFWVVWLLLVDKISISVPIAEELSFFVAVTIAYLVTVGVFASKMGASLPRVKNMQIDVRRYDLPIMVVLTAVWIWVF